MRHTSSKSIALAVAALIILIVGGLWAWDTYEAGKPASNKRPLVTWVDRGIQEESLPIFLQRVEDLKAELAAADAEGRRDVTIYLRLGNAYYTLGELGKAAENYREILRTNPQDSPAHENLAQALVEMGDFAGAEAEWRLAIQYGGTEQSYLKLAAFFDVGNVWATVEDFGSGEFKTGTGLGLRVKTPIGPINLDYGYPLSNEPGEEGRTGKFYFSVSRGF